MLRPRIGSQAWLRAVVTWTAISFISSIQGGTITIADPAVANTATIAAVDTSRSIVLFLNGWKTVNAVAQDVRINDVRLVLTNATTVTATRALTGFDNTTGSFVVIEFMPGVLKRLQYFQSVWSGVTNTDAVISAVNLSKTVALWCGGNSNSNLDGLAYLLGIPVNSTTVRWVSNNGTGWTSNGVVVEFW